MWKALYKEAEKIPCDGVVAIAPIYYYTQVTLSKPWLTCHWHEIPHYETWSIDVKARNRAW